MITHQERAGSRTLRLATATLLLLGACITPKPTFVTPSGKPEVDYPAPKAAVKDALVSQMIQGGYTVKNSTEYSLVFEKPGGLAQNLLAGSTYNAQTMLRVTYNVVDAPGGVKVIGHAAVVSNPGGAFEKVTDVTGGKPANQVYEIMQAAKAALRKTPPD